VEVCVRDRLTRGFAHVDPEVVAIGVEPGVDALPNGLDERPDGDALRLREGEEISLVTAWDDQGMARAHGERVREGGGPVILGQDVAGCEPVAEHARHPGPPCGSIHWGPGEWEASCHSVARLTSGAVPVLY
jgi:hypothetical protein